MSTEAQRAKHREAMRIWRAAHKDIVTAREAAARKQDPERFREYKRLEYQRHKDERRAKVNDYRLRNPEKIKALHQAWYLKNRERLSAERRAKYRQHPDLAMTEHLRRHYDLTVAEYDAMLAAQGGGCAICRQIEPGGRAGHGRKPRFHVDHDHASGQIRGLLCHGCNVGIGALRDDPNIVRSAADYIERQKIEKIA